MKNNLNKITLALKTTALNIGYTIGRFNPLHLGHTSMIDKMIEENDYVIILVGSANLSRENKNPFTYSERVHLLSNLYPNIIILPLNDYDDEKVWIETVDSKINEAITILNLQKNVVNINLYTGGDNKGNDAELRKQWCEPLGHNVVPVHLDSDLSATIIRDHFYSRNTHKIQNDVPKNVFKFLTQFENHADFERLLLEK
jgi:bifunctional NMN adenylyltransferase/nudix hydrolase